MNPKIFLQVCKQSGLPVPVTEFRFHLDRRWRFDYAWILPMVALEVEGGVWTGGRHSRGKRMIADMQKYNTAACMAWKVIRCTPDTLLSKETLLFLRTAIEMSKP